MNLRITHLYPDFLNLYGDRGNMAALSKRLIWRNIDEEVVQVTGDMLPDLQNTDILFLGGGSDREQAIVCDKLLKIKEAIRAYVENGGVVVAVCGGYQLLGNFYKLHDQTIEGLGIVDIETVQGEGRLIGNIVLDCEIDGKAFQVVGFENHGGRTNIKEHTPLGKVVSGYGNNGEDGVEGVLYKNVFGTYLHGPLFPKNPTLTDIVLSRALKRKYPDFTGLQPLPDEMEAVAAETIKQRIMTQKA